MQVDQGQMIVISVRGDQIAQSMKVSEWPKLTIEGHDKPYTQYPVLLRALRRD